MSPFSSLTQRKVFWEMKWIHELTVLCCHWCVSSPITAALTGRMGWSRQLNVYKLKSSWGNRFGHLTQCPFPLHNTCIHRDTHLDYVTLRPLGSRNLTRTLRRDATPEQDEPGLQRTETHTAVLSHTLMSNTITHSLLEICAHSHVLTPWQEVYSFCMFF